MIHDQQIRDPVSRVRQSFDMQGESLVVDNWLEPGGAMPPRHHPQQEERWSVVDGEVRFRHGDQELVIGPEAGEIVVAPGDIHGLRNNTDREAHLRCYVTPPLRLQRFLEEAAEAGQQGLFSKRGLPRGLRSALGCQLSQALWGRDRVGVAADDRAARADRAARTRCLIAPTRGGRRWSSGVWAGVSTLAGKTPSDALPSISAR